MGAERAAAKVGGLIESSATVGVGAKNVAGQEDVAKGVETVQRWMSKAELDATKETGLLRGGRDGEHYVTDSTNNNPLRARQRSALPQTPQIKVTMDVPKGRFSAPSRVDPRYDMPGGGMERTATGNIPVNIRGVEIW